MFEFGDARLPPTFWSKAVVDPSTGCWRWIASNTGVQGYGQFGVARRMRLAHRVAYERLVGPIPHGLSLDHVKARGCAGPVCCNPMHLEPVTHRENVMRGNAPAARWAQRTHCDRGHPFDDVNTRFEKDRRVCRTCHAARGRHRRARERAARNV